MRSVLVIDCHLIGDIVRLTAFLQDMKAIYPQASLSLVAGPWAKDILLHNDVVDDLIIFHAPWAYDRGYTIRSLRDLFFLVKTLRKKKFDLGIDVRGDLRQIGLLYVSNITRRVGFDAMGGGPFLTDIVSLDNIVDSLQRNFAISTYLKQQKAHAPKLWLSKDETNSIVSYKNQYLGKKILGISPGASHALKAWGDRAVLELRRVLLETYPDLHLVWLLGPGDKKIESQLIGSLTGQEEILKGTLRQFIVKIASLDIYVGMDSGGGHVAGAFQIPSVILCGPYEPVFVVPHNPRLEVLFKDFGCSNCSLHCRYDQRCMKAIRVEEVVQKIALFL